MSACLSATVLINHNLVHTNPFSLFQTHQGRQPQPSLLPAVKTPPPLQYRDVMIIPDWYQNVDNLADSDDDEDDDSDEDDDDDTAGPSTEGLRRPGPAERPEGGQGVEGQGVGRAGGRVAQRASSGLVRGLRSRGVPVRVVRSQDGARIRELARCCGPRDAVWVVAWGVGNGLERKVVVSVGEGRGTSDGVSGVLHGASRCLSQLVYVTCP